MQQTSGAPQRPPSWPWAWVLPNQRSLVLPAFLFLLALIPRLAWTLSADTEKVYRPVYDAMPVDYVVPPGMDDITYYLHTSRSIAQGEGYTEPFLGTPSARYPPGWPAALSIFYFFFGPNALPAVVFNAVIGAAASVLVYLLGSHLFDRRVGLGAGFIMALFPIHIFYSPVLLTEVFFTSLLTLALLLAISVLHDWRALLLGVLAGAATLVRGETVLLPAVFLVVLLLRGATWHACARQTVLIGAGMAILLLPWIVRNSIQLEAPVFLNTQTGVNLFFGHATAARSERDVVSHFSYFGLVADYRDLPEPQRQVEIDQAAFNEAWKGFRSDPPGDLAQIPSKLRDLYRHDPMFGPTRLLVAAFWHGPLSFRAARLLADAYYYMVLGGAALLLFLRRPASWRGAYGLLYGVIVLWSFTFGFLFYGDNRYHIPLLPILSIAAAAGFAGTWDLLVSGRRQIAAEPPAALAGTAASKRDSR